mmetsp:Transcript_8809/g.18073  ORF Transcript_8809/g.18073 Transcript_8809/m.18073 type:complete len:489 (+) Transcript_8809:328-1794(+)
MILPLQLHHHLDLHLIHARVQPGPLVHHVLDGRPVLVQQIRQPRDAPRAVGDGGDEPTQPVVGGEAPVEDPSEGGGVDVAPAERDHDVLALEGAAVEVAFGEEGGEARGAAPLDHHFFVLDEAEDREGDLLFAARDRLVDVVPGHFEGVGSDAGHRQPVGQGGFHVCKDGLAHGQRLDVTGRPFRLHPVHLTFGFERLDGTGDPRNESRAAHWHHHCIHVWHVLHDLDPDGPRPRHDGRIVVPVDVGQPLGGDEGLGVLLGLPDVRPLDDDARPEPPALVHLGQRGHRGHHHGHRHPQLPPVVRQRERVVPRRRGDRPPAIRHELRAALPQQRQEGVARAPLLEGPRELPELGLQVHVRADDVAQELRFFARGARHAPPDGHLGAGDVGEGHRQVVEVLERTGRQSIGRRELDGRGFTGLGCGRGGGRRGGGVLRTRGEVGDGAKQRGAREGGRGAPEGGGGSSRREEHVVACLSVRGSREGLLLRGI